MSGIARKLMGVTKASGGFDPNTPIGTFIEGGYFAGFIVQGGNTFAIIIAPKSDGESATTLRYKSTNSAPPLAAQTLNDGFGATAAMVADGDATVYPAAHFCNDLEITGFSDWYLPARDELELCYRNFKPTTASNNTSNRTKSSIVYPEGDDLFADTQGRNRNSDPEGAAYAASDPLQTSIVSFQNDEAEFFVPAGAYWCASDFSDTSAWGQFFADGLQAVTVKSNLRRVRAVRRVPV